MDKKQQDQRLDKPIKVPQEIHRKVKTSAAQEGIEMKEYVVRALQFYWNHTKD